MQTWMMTWDNRSCAGQYASLAMMHGEGRAECAQCEGQEMGEL